MTSFLPYLLKLSISLAVVYLFYHLFLRRLTFYNWNRWYLVIYSVLSFFIPFINIYPILEKNNWSRNEVLEYIPVVGYKAIWEGTELSSTWTYRDWTILFIIAGMAIMIIRSVIQQISFVQIRRSSTLIINDKVKVYQVDKNIIPFSFGNSIYVNQHQHNREELKEIIRHEFIHVKQKHTFDILWCEWLCILNWYNPFAWLIRQSVRQNLEFIADHKVLQNGIDKKEYQYLLLKVVGVSQFSIAPQFNFSSLKKRIAMMNKMKSAKVHLIKFLFIVPLVAILLLAFRNQLQKAPAQVAAVSNFLHKDTIPARVQKPAKAAKVEFPEGVTSIQIDDNRATVQKKNGQIEKYNFDKPEEKAAFEKKYGEVLPPPPPPPIAELPSPASLANPPVPAFAPSPVSTPNQLPPPSTPTKKKANAKGYVITIADNQGECVVIIKDKNYKIVRAMELTEWNRDEKENIVKYGEIPPPPPPQKLSPAAGPVRSNLVPAAPVVPPPGIDHGVIVTPSQESIYAKPFNKIFNSTQPNVIVSGVSPISDVLVIVDGVEQPKGESALKELNPNNIERVEVLKDQSAKAIYGMKGSNGVIIITTKKEKDSNNSNDPIIVDHNRMLSKSKTTINNLDSFTGIIFIDGVETDKKDLNHKLEASDIKSVEVISGDRANVLYGEKGKNGVIIIKTKKEVIVTSTNKP